MNSIFKEKNLCCLRQSQNSNGVSKEEMCSFFPLVAVRAGFLRRRNLTRKQSLLLAAEWLKPFCFFILLFISGLLHAAPASNPTDMLQSVSNQMLSSLPQIPKHNDRALYQLIKQVLLPHVDLNQMSEKVTGAYWATATPEQQAQFQQEFTQFVTRTYSSALSSYTNETVKFFPIRGGISGDQVQVNSVITQSNGNTIAVTYRLSGASGDWKIYDFSVEGVSIVDNYRSQFADVLRTKGMASLIQQLTAQNQRKS